MELSPVIQKGVLQFHSLWQEEGEARSLVAHHKKSQLSSQFPVIPLSCLLHHVQVVVQLALLGISHAVDPGEHLVLLIPSPVGACKAGKLKCLHRLRGHKMRACAQICEFSLAVETDLSSFRKIFHQLYLIRFLFLLKICHRFVSGSGKALQLQILFDDLLHLRLDLLQILCGKWSLPIQVIVESIGNGRTDGKLGLRIEPLYRLGHDVGGGVPIGVLALCRVEGEDLQGAVLLDGGAQIADLPVNLGGAGGLVQAHADGLGHFRGGDALVELLDLAFQINLYHRVLLSAGANKNLPQQSSGAGIRLKKNLPKPAVPPGFKGSRRRLFRFLVWACNGAGRRPLGKTRSGRCSKVVSTSPAPAAAFSPRQPLSGPGAPGYGFLLTAF